MNWNGLVHQDGGFSWICRNEHCLCSITATSVRNLTLSDLRRYAEEAEGWHDGYCNLCALARTFSNTLKNIEAKNT